MNAQIAKSFKASSDSGFAELVLEYKKVLCGLRKWAIENTCRKPHRREKKNENSLRHN
jgi:hypothetical protein